jgi:hypothetical protein
MDFRAAIEFEGAVLAGARHEGDDVALQLEPASFLRWDRRCVRWYGTCWVRPALLLLRRAKLIGTPPSQPTRIAAARVTVAGRDLGDALPIAPVPAGALDLRLTLDTGATLELRAAEAAVHWTGEARFVEELPEESRPLG